RNEMVVVFAQTAVFNRVLPFMGNRFLDLAGQERSATRRPEPGPCARRGAAGGPPRAAAPRVHLAPGRGRAAHPAVLPGVGVVLPRARPGAAMQATLPVASVLLCCTYCVSRLLHYCRTPAGVVLDPGRHDPGDHVQRVRSRSAGILVIRRPGGIAGHHDLHFGSDGVRHDGLPHAPRVHHPPALGLQRRRVTGHHRARVRDAAAAGARRHRVRHLLGSRRRRHRMVQVALRALVPRAVPAGVAPASTSVPFVQAGPARRLLDRRVRPCQRPPGADKHLTCAL
ncbi:unnamed protein product, partial [Prorocentrum cordatum]